MAAVVVVVETGDMGAEEADEDEEKTIENRDSI